MNALPPYQAICHTLCRVRSIARWLRLKDNNTHNILWMGYFTREARCSLRIVYNRLMPCDNVMVMTRYRVFLVHMLLTWKPINVGAVMIEKMKYTKEGEGRIFYYGDTLTQIRRMYLRRRKTRFYL